MQVMNENVCIKEYGTAYTEFKSFLSDPELSEEIKKEKMGKFHHSLFPFNPIETAIQVILAEKPSLEPQIEARMNYWLFHALANDWDVNALLDSSYPKNIFASVKKGNENLSYVAKQDEYPTNAFSLAKQKWQKGTEKSHLNGYILAGAALKQYPFSAQTQANKDIQEKCKKLMWGAKNSLTYLYNYAIKKRDSTKKTEDKKIKSEHKKFVKDIETFMSKCNATLLTFLYETLKPEAQGEPAMIKAAHDKFVASCNTLITKVEEQWGEKDPTLANIALHCLVALVTGIAPVAIFMLGNYCFNNRWFFFSGNYVNDFKKLEARLYNEIESSLISEKPTAPGNTLLG